MGEFNLRERTIGQIKAAKADFVKTKDRFQLAEEKLLDSIIEKESLLGDPSKNQLVPPSLRKDKLKKDLHDSLESLDLDLDLSPALKILKEEGASYLDSEIYKVMVDQLEDIPKYLEQMDLLQPPKENLYTNLHISESTLQAINSVGVSKYDEGKFDSSLSIFCLLSTLDHENEVWLYRLGISAAQMEKWDQALKAFTYSLYLNPSLIGARIFSAECYIRLGKAVEAKEEINEAKRLIELSSSDTIWLEVLTSIENLISNK